MGHLAIIYHTLYPVHADFAISGLHETLRFFPRRSARAAAVPFFAAAPAGPGPRPPPKRARRASDASTAAASRAERDGRQRAWIVITGRRLDTARDSITPSLGASQYTFDKEALEKQPGGTNLTLNKSLLQAPGVVQDSYGVIHVRNEHANLQYRLNGVIVPESISGFGTTFDPGSRARSSSSPGLFQRSTATAPQAWSISRPSRACWATAERSGFTPAASAGSSRAR